MSATAVPQAPPRKKMSPRKRAKMIRTIQYIILVVVAVILIFIADWPMIAAVFVKPSEILVTLTQGLGKALLNTIIYSIGAFVIGLALGTLLALMKLSSVGPYRWIGQIYTEIFRGLPALVVLLLFANLAIAFAGLVMPFDPYGTVWIALGIVYAAYMSETIRAGILAVPKGQVEAARSLGMSSTQSTVKIVLPQAFRIIIPPLTNELISLVKDSSLVYILGLSAAGFDLTKYGRDLANAQANLTPLVVAGFCYLLITLPLGALVRRMEKHNRKATA